MGRRLSLILGGARSGKSRQAERMAAAAGGEVLFVATAEGLDEEMAARIEAHRARRPASWRTLEAPHHVGQAIAAEGRRADVVVLDCITLLASNVFDQHADDNPALQGRPVEELRVEIEGLLATFRRSAGHWIVVSNEVGQGLVPPFALGRAYRDALGRANQQLAEAADDVILMIAGLPLAVKELPRD